MLSNSLYVKPDINEPHTEISSNVANKYGTQVIDIRSVNPVIDITIPGMSVPYAGVQCDSLVRYMISYFDFPGEAITLYQGETIYVYANIAWTRTTEPDDQATQVTYHEGTESPYNFIGFPFIAPRDIVGDAAEIANFLQESMSAFVRSQFQFIDGIATTSPIFYTALQLAYAFRCVTSFAYDGAAGKFGFVFDPTTALSTVGQTFQPVYTDGVITSADDYLGYNVDFFLRVDPSLSQLRQTQIAQMLGWDPSTQQVEIDDVISGQVNTCYEIPFYGIATQQQPQGNPGQTIEPLISPFYSMANLAYLLTHSSTPFGGTEAFMQYSMQSAQTWLQYAPLVAAIQQSDFVYVRSSLNTANWDQATGNATNVLAVLPWARDFTSTPQFNHVDQENFGAIEKAQALKHFTISLTDADGNTLTFIKPFTLRIVIVPVQ